MQLCLAASCRKENTILMFSDNYTKENKERLALRGMVGTFSTSLLSPGVSKPVIRVDTEMHGAHPPTKTHAATASSTSQTLGEHSLHTDTHRHTESQEHKHPHTQ